MPAGFLPTLTLLAQKEPARSHPLQHVNLHLQGLVSWLFSFAARFVPMTPVDSCGVALPNNEKMKN